MEFTMFPSIKQTCHQDRSVLCFLIDIMLSIIINTYLGGKMSKKHFYKTGDVASFNSVSSDTVRLYDKEELVTPSFTDNNGYRYYKFDEVLKFNTATAFRELGFSIENIKNYSKKKISITFLLQQKINSKI